VGVKEPRELESLHSRRERLSRHAANAEGGNGNGHREVEETQPLNETAASVFKDVDSLRHKTSGKIQTWARRFQRANRPSGGSLFYERTFLFHLATLFHTELNR